MVVLPVDLGPAQPSCIRSDEVFLPLSPAEVGDVEDCFVDRAASSPELLTDDIRGADRPRYCGFRLGHCTHGPADVIHVGLPSTTLAGGSVPAVCSEALRTIRGHRPPRSTSHLKRWNGFVKICVAALGAAVPCGHRDRVN